MSSCHNCIGARLQAGRPPGCITTPRPSLTFGCSSTTIYGCGSLTERQPRRTAAAQGGSGDASVHVLYATSGVAARPAKATDRKRRYPLILGSDHPLLKQAHQNRLEIPDAVPVSGLLIWPVAACLWWRVAFD